MKNSALLVVTFYLSKFGSKDTPRAYLSLGYKNRSEAFESGLYPSPHFQGPYELDKCGLVVHSG